MKKLFLLFLLFGTALTITCQPTQIFTSKNTLAQTVIVNYEQKSELQAAEIIIDFTKSEKYEPLESIFKDKQPHSALSQIQNTELQRLQKLIKTNIEIFKKKRGVKKISFEAVLKPAKPEDEIFVQFELSREPKSPEDLTLSVNLYGKQAQPCEIIMNFINCLCKQDSFLHRNKSLFQISFIALCALGIEAQQDVSYVRAFNRRFIFKKTSAEEQEFYQNLLDGFLTNAPVKTETPEILYKKLNKTTVVLAKTGKILFPAGSTTIEYDGQDRIYLIPFSKINSSELKRAANTLNLTGWKVYFFDDLGTGLAGINAFKGFNMQCLKKFNYLSKINGHRIITKEGLGMKFIMPNEPESAADQTARTIQDFLNAKIN